MNGIPTSASSVNETSVSPSTGLSRYWPRNAFNPPRGWRKSMRCGGYNVARCSDSTGRPAKYPRSWMVSAAGVRSTRSAVSHSPVTRGDKSRRLINWNTFWTGARTMRRPSTFTIELPGTGDREFVSDETRRLDHDAKLADRLVDRPRLQSAVGRDVHLRGRDDPQRLADAVGHLLHRLDAVAVRVHDTQADVLRERRGSERLEEREFLVLQGQVELVHGQSQHRRIDLGDVAVTDVAHGVRGGPLRHDLHRLDGELEVFLGPGVDGGLVDLDESRPRALPIHDLVLDGPGPLADELPPGRVVFVERPLRDGVGAGQH